MHGGRGKRGLGRRRYGRRSRSRRGGRGRGGLTFGAGVGHSVLNNGANRRIVLKLDAFLSGNLILFAHDGEQFGLFDRINAQVGFHIQVQIQHVFGVAGLFGHNRQNIFGYVAFVQARQGRFRRSRRSGNRSRSRGRRYGRGGRSRRGLGRRGGTRFTTRIGDSILNNGANGRIVFKLDAFLTRNLILFAHNGEEFRLFDRINAQVGFHVQVQIQHIFGIAGLFGHNRQNIFGYVAFVQARQSRFRRTNRRSSRRRSRGGRGLGRRRYGRGSRSRFGMNGVDFIHKSLRSFHDQRRFDTVFVIVFYAQGIVFHFQHRIFLVGNLLEPGFVFGRIGNARFTHAPHFFQQRHADLRAETRRQTQRVFKVVMAAFA